MRELFVFLLLLVPSYVRAAEVTTNGVGGGPWSDPATWRGNAVPGPDDDAVIRKGDAVVFDRNDDGKVTCQKLLIDPRGALRFKTGAGKVVLSCAAGVETYGPISLDGAKAGAGDLLELRMTGDDAAKRAVKLMKGGALIARGKAGARTVALTAPPAADPKMESIATVVTAGAGTTVDLRDADLAGVAVEAADIDSTGSKAGERFGVVGCRFTGLGRVACARCDTPTIAGNTFNSGDPKRRTGRAVQVAESPLAEVKDNTVTGGYEVGIALGSVLDGAVSGNTVEACQYGISVGHGAGTAVVRNVVRDCDFGYQLYYTHRATVEDATAVGCRTGIYAVHTTSQIGSFHAEKTPMGGFPLHVISDANSRGQVVLLNCDLKADQVNLQLGAIKKEGTPPPVVAMAYLVVAVKNAPEGAAVDVVPSAVKDALAVRNSPALLTKGLTPRPTPPGVAAAGAPLIVRSWSFDADGKEVPTPAYSVRVLAPGAAPGAEPRVLASATVSPTEKWFRAKPEDPAPTLEVTVP